jgi:hypothetical protein
MNEPIEDVLHRLRATASESGAPDALEAKLVQAYRKHHKTKRRPWMWIPAAVAASVLLAVAGRAVFLAGRPAAKPAPMREIAARSKAANSKAVVAPEPIKQAAVVTRRAKPVASRVKARPKPRNVPRRAAF